MKTKLVDTYVHKIRVCAASSRLITHLVSKVQFTWERSVSFIQRFGVDQFLILFFGLHHLLHRHFFLHRPLHNDEANSPQNTGNNLQETRTKQPLGVNELMDPFSSGYYNSGSKCLGLCNNHANSIIV